jgi:type IV secretion system protein VirB11
MPRDGEDLRRIPDSAAEALRKLLAPLLPHLEREGVTDLVVNRPGEIGVEVRGQWEWHEEPRLDLRTLEAICRGLAGHARQEINERLPICSAVLPDGQRVQLLIPPATLPGRISMTIRKPPHKIWSTDELEEQGFFSAIGANSVVTDNGALVELHSAGQWREFFELAVRLSRNIVISGATGSAKTSFARALMCHIPDHERLITGEDTHELVALPQRNLVHLLYPQNRSQAVAQIGARELMTAALRMRPDRVIFPELRDGTAYYFLRSVASGHPGVITTVHANSCDMAWEVLTLLVRESQGAEGLDRQDIKGLLRQAVDIVVQLKWTPAGPRVLQVELNDRKAQQ